MRNLTDRLTYANVMATVAVFVAFGGSAYAVTQLPKNSVGTKQLKKSAVTGAKVASNTLTGVNIQAATLGTVPQAVHADSASGAANAAHAGDSDQLGGDPPSSFKDRCPAGTHPVAPNLCIEEATDSENYVGSIEACAKRGLRLMTPSEAFTASPKHVTWTDDFWTDGSTSFALAYDPEQGGGPVLLAFLESAELERTCVITPTDS